MALHKRPWAVYGCIANAGSGAKAPSSILAGALPDIHVDHDQTDSTGLWIGVRPANTTSVSQEQRWFRLKLDKYLPFTLSCPPNQLRAAFVNIRFFL